MWVLSFSVDGRKHTETIPEEWVPQLADLVERGNELRDGLAELLRINAELLHLWREQQRTKGSKRGKSKGKLARPNADSPR